MRKLLAIALALVMALTCCSFAAAEGESLVVTAMMPDFMTDSEFNTTDNPILDYIEEQTGVRLDIRFVANSSYGDVLATTLADPASMPMLISFTGRDNVYVQTAKAGAFWDLTEYVTDSESYPYLASDNAQPAYANSAVDGKVFGIFRSRAYPRAGIYYRSDIAAKMGITEAPTTIDELTELAEALAEYGKENGGWALNMCEYTAGTISIITVLHGAPNVWGVDEEGNVYAAHESEAYLEGLNWLRHLYEIGGIDPDFATISSSTWNDIERTGKGYMRFDCNDNAHRQQEWFEKNEGVTETIFDEVVGLAKDDGSITIWPQNAGYAGLVAVTKTVSEDDLETVLAFLDWCNSAAGQITLNSGLENVTYWIWEDGTQHAYPVELQINEGDDEATVADKTAKQNEITAYANTIHGSMNQLGMGTPGDLTPAGVHSELRDKYAANNLEYAKNAVVNPCLTLESQTYISYGSDLDKMLSSAAVQYIAGIISEDELRAVWADWSAQGGDKIKEEYTEALAAQN